MQNIVTKFASWYESANKSKSPFRLEEVALYNQKRQLKIAVETCKLAHKLSLGVLTPSEILIKLDHLIWKLDTPGLSPSQEMFREVLSALHLAKDALSPLTVESVQNLLDAITTHVPVVDETSRPRESVFRDTFSRTGGLINHRNMCGKGVE